MKKEQSPYFFVFAGKKNLHEGRYDVEQKNYHPEEYDYEEPKDEQEPNYDDEDDL